MPLKAIMWSVIGMSLFRNETLWDIASRLDITLTEKINWLRPVFSSRPSTFRR
ncbi:hypothetical protein CWC18_05755 [Pseudoalteromonas aurantia]|uniref:Transposase IS4 N-terminal domain-containing protein n=1 Tax=Pseudoalteromonas aurantia TaxID=43654 RepID=A0ABY2VV74_9GAMM|nr:hypothetical protein CWC18_05755 [Pseudoalteromonas aurantia]TMO72547.1 hypothetical protein CWC20_14990 [Pseudoalteromonas aurantia]